MKRFIIISLLTVLSLPILACAWSDPTNPYLFSMYQQNDFKNRVERICNDNWKAYLGSTEEYFWFNADDAINAARRKGDVLMVSYLQNLKKYLNCVDIEQRKQYEWDYPTKKAIATQQRNLQTVRTYALGKTKSKLRSQHALLYMRCNMMLGRHQDNINFWQQTASKYIETVYKDMMKNIYAGALYKTGRTAEAGELFAEMDDYESLMTIYYQKRSFQAIRQQYQQQPNAKVLPFLLQDFVNNAQEAEDAKNEGNIGGKLFIRDINQQESQQMQQFCEQVVREGKTTAPTMWMSAKAWLEYLAGQQQAALKDINAAMKLDGTDRMKDNARVLKLFITTATAKPSDSFDAYFAEELAWLLSKQQTADGFFDHAMRRLSHQAIVPHYQHKPEQQLALMIITGNTDYLERIDTMPVANLEKFYHYTKTTGKKAFDQFLLRQLHLNDTSLVELIGTKYMRLAQWDKAIKWLSPLPVGYFNQQHSNEYRYYSLMRRYDIEPWITRQWLDTNKAYEHTYTWKKNIKLDFCQEMQSLESALNLLQGQAYEQRCYELAVRYAQASIKGDCWWLLRDAKSAYDSVRVNETDFGAKAVELLQRTASSANKDLKLKALFAMGWQELYNATSGAKLWRADEWDDQQADYVRKYYSGAAQFRAYQSVYALTGPSASQPTYITKCDEYQQFRKYYTKHKTGI